MRLGQHETHPGTCSVMRVGEVYKTPTSLRKLREEEGESHRTLTDEMIDALLCPTRLHGALLEQVKHRLRISSAPPT